MKKPIFERITEEAKKEAALLVKETKSEASRILKAGKDAAARHYAQATEDTLPKFIRRAKNFLEKHTWEDYVHGIPDADKPADVIPAGRYIPGVEATRKYLEEQRRQFEGGAASG